MCTFSDFSCSEFFHSFDPLQLAQIERLMSEALNPQISTMIPPITEPYSLLDRSHNRALSKSITVSHASSYPMSLPRLLKLVIGHKKTLQSKASKFASFHSTLQSFENYDHRSVLDLRSVFVNSYCELYLLFRSTLWVLNSRNHARKPSHWRNFKAVKVNFSRKRSLEHWRRDNRIPLVRVTMEGPRLTLSQC